jgi:hypothetical protein
MTPGTVILNNVMNEDDVITVRVRRGRVMGVAIRAGYEGRDKKARIDNKGRELGTAIANAMRRGYTVEHIAEAIQKNLALPSHETNTMRGTTP